MAIEEPNPLDLVKGLTHQDIDSLEQQWKAAEPDRADYFTQQFANMRAWKDRQIRESRPLVGFISPPAALGYQLANRLFGGQPTPPLQSAGPGLLEQSFASGVGQVAGGAAGLGATLADEFGARNFATYLDRLNRSLTGALQPETTQAGSSASALLPGNAAANPYAALEYLTGTAGQGVGSTLGTLATGPVAPLSVYGMGVNEARQQMQAAGVEHPSGSLGATALALGVPYALVETRLGALPGLRRLLTEGGLPGLRNAFKDVLGKIAPGEALEEVIQQGLDRFAGALGLNSRNELPEGVVDYLTNKEALKDYVESGVGGAIGGIAGGALGHVALPTAPARVEQRQAEVAQQMAAGVERGIPAAKVTSGIPETPETTSYIPEPVTDLSGAEPYFPRLAEKGHTTEELTKPENAAQTVALAQREREGVIQEAQQNILNDTLSRLTPQDMDTLFAKNNEVRQGLNAETIAQRLKSRGVEVPADTSIADWLASNATFDAKQDVVPPLVKRGTVYKPGYLFETKPVWKNGKTTGTYRLVQREAALPPLTQAERERAATQPLFRTEIKPAQVRARQAPLDPRVAPSMPGGEISLTRVPIVNDVPVAVDAVRQTDNGPVADLTELTRKRDPQGRPFWARGDQQFTVPAQTLNKAPKVLYPISGVTPRGAQEFMAASRSPSMELPRATERTSAAPSEVATLPAPPGAEISPALLPAPPAALPAPTETPLPTTMVQPGYVPPALPAPAQAPMGQVPMGYAPPGEFRPGMTPAYAPIPMPGQIQQALPAPSAIPSLTGPEPPSTLPGPERPLSIGYTPSVPPPRLAVQAPETLAVPPRVRFYDMDWWRSPAGWAEPSTGSKEHPTPAALGKRQNIPGVTQDRLPDGRIHEVTQLPNGRSSEVVWTPHYWTKAERGQEARSSLSTINDALRNYQFRMGWAPGAIDYAIAHQADKDYGQVRVFELRNGAFAYTFNRTPPGAVRQVGYYSGVPLDQLSIREVYENFVDLNIPVLHKNADQAAFRSFVQAEVKRLVPSANVEFVSGLINGRSFGEAEPGLIRLSMLLANPELAAREGRTAQGILHHEAWHLAEGLWTPAENNVLRERARRVWMDRYGIADLYADLAKPDQEREAIARAYEDFVLRQTKTEPALRRVFQPLTNLLRRMGNWLSGHGYATPEDVFEEFYRGERTGPGGSLAAAPAEARSRFAVSDTAGARLDREAEAAGLQDTNAKGILQRLLRFLTQDPLDGLPQHEQFEYLLGQTLGQHFKYRARAHKFARTLAKMPEGDWSLIKDFFETRNADDKILPEEVRALAVEVKQEINLAGAKLVELGVITQAQFEAHRDEYLPRKYLWHLLPADKREEVTRRVGGGAKPSDLGYKKARDPAMEGVISLILGEIKNPAVLVSNFYMKQARDIAIFEMYDRVSENKDWVLRDNLVDYQGVQVSDLWLRGHAKSTRDMINAGMYDRDPEAKARVAAEADLMERLAGQVRQLPADLGNYRLVPDSPRYGRLAGMYLRKEIYEQLIESRPLTELLGLPVTFTIGGRMHSIDNVARGAMDWWRASRVALNPPTVVRNVISGLFQMWTIGRMSWPQIIKYYGESLQAYINYKRTGSDPFWDKIIDIGVPESNLSVQELQRQQETYLRYAADAHHSGVDAFFAFAGRIMEGGANLYGLFDTLAKAAVIKKELAHGSSIEHALNMAQKALFNYAVVPPSIRALRNNPWLGSPFLTYAYKTIPAFAQLLKTPGGKAKLSMAIASVPLASAMASISLGLGGGDDRDKIFKLLNEHQQRRWGQWLLPVKDERGNYQVVDLGAFMPWAPVADFISTAARGKVGTALQQFIGFGGGPAAQALTAYLSGKNPHTDREITEEWKSGKQQALDVLYYVANSYVLPPYLNMSADGASALPGAFARFVEQAGGPRIAGGLTIDKTSRELKNTPAQLALRQVGVNVTSVNPQAARIAQIRRYDWEIGQIKADRSKRLLRAQTPEQRREIVQQTQEQLLQKQQDKIDFLRETAGIP